MTRPSPGPIAPRTMLRKIWDSHRVAVRDGGEALLYVDRHYAHEGSFHAFDILKLQGRSVRRPDLTLCIADHYVPTVSRDAADASPEIANMVEQLSENARRENLPLLAMGDAGQGIVHVVGPELGMTQPGLVIVCGDSHTSTHGAFGALAFGIGASEVAHVLATQTIWQAPPKVMRVSVDGTLGAGVTAKDVILSIIASIGADGASGHVLEYAGSAIRSLSMDGRMTVCNMSIEAGGRAGMIAPDDTTINYLRGRPYVPTGADWEAAEADWRSLASDADASFDREARLDAGTIAPSVTWGNSPEDAVPVTASVPDPSSLDDEGASAAMAATLEYMGLEAGTRLVDVPIDRAFIGSCTNARLDDLRAAAEIAKGRRAVVPAVVVPGSTAIKAAAEAEGLDRIFEEAGFEWRHSGCSMCVGINGDTAAAGERVASTTNRNFRGRQGKGSRTHLMGPAMAAAAAVTGRITDVRQLVPAPAGQRD